MARRVAEHALDALALAYGLECDNAYQPDLVRSKYATVRYGVGGEREWEWTDRKRGYGRAYHHAGAWYDARTNEVVLHDSRGREVQRTPGAHAILPVCRRWRWPGAEEFCPAGQMTADATAALVYADWLADHGHPECEQWVRRWVRETTEATSASSGKPPSRPGDHPRR